MTTPSQNNHRPRAARGPDRASVETRTARSLVVANQAPSSALWTGSVKTTGLALIQAGTDLTTGHADAQTLRLAADAADKEVITARIEWDECHRIYSRNVELVAVKPEDIVNLGLPLLIEQTYALLAPLGVSARYDLVKSRLLIAVRPPPGTFRCRIEISPNPITPGSFVALPGKGMRRALTGYASGGWWVRALMYDGENESAYTEPVFVKVP